MTYGFYYSVTYVHEAAGHVANAIYKRKKATFCLHSQRVYAEMPLQISLHFMSVWLECQAAI